MKLHETTVYLGYINIMFSHKVSVKINPLKMSLKTYPIVKYSIKFYVMVTIETNWRFKLYKLMKLSIMYN